MAVGPVWLRSPVRMVVRRCGVFVVHRNGWKLRGAVRKPDRDLGRLHPCPVHLGDFYANLGTTKPGWQSPQPVFAGSQINQGPQQHVAADSGRGVDDGKTAVGHRLGNIAP